MTSSEIVNRIRQSFQECETYFFAMIWLRAKSYSKTKWKAWYICHTSYIQYQRRCSCTINLNAAAPRQCGSLKNLVKHFKSVKYVPQWFDFVQNKILFENKINNLICMSNIVRSSIPRFSSRNPLSMVMFTRSIPMQLLLANLEAPLRKLLSRRMDIDADLEKTRILVFSVNINPMRISAHERYRFPVEFFDLGKGSGRKVSRRGDRGRGLCGELKKRRLKSDQRCKGSCEDCLNVQGCDTFFNIANFYQRVSRWKDSPLVP